MAIEPVLDVYTLNTIAPTMEPTLDDEISDHTILLADADSEHTSRHELDDCGLTGVFLMVISLGRRQRLHIT